MGGTLRSGLLRLGTFGHGLMATGLLTAVVLAGCGPTQPTSGPIPRRPQPPGQVSVEPPPRPQYGGVGPQRVSVKSGVDVTREPLTLAITVDTGPDAAMALRLADQAREELNRGTTGRALELLDAAVEQDPKTVEPYVIRAQAYLVEGASEEAREDLQRAVELGPSTPWLAEVVAINGGIFELDGNVDAAVAAYRRALQISAANVSAREALVRLSEK